MASPVDSCDYLPFFCIIYIFFLVIIILLYAFYHHYRFHLITVIYLSNYDHLLRTHSFIYDFPYTGYPYFIFYRRRLCSCSSLFIFSSSLFLFFFSSCSPCHLPTSRTAEQKENEAATSLTVETGASDLLLMRNSGRETNKQN